MSSRASRLTGISNEGISYTSVESAEMMYRRLSFEDGLFTAEVYKRNYRTRSQLKSNSKKAAHNSFNPNKLRMS